jgi:prepilin-type N-terminal cleavage/methylation domain-containing protein
MSAVRPWRRRGFTFIEMTLVTALIGIISLSVYSSFSAGAKVWQRSSKKIPETEIGVFFDKISNDLRNWLDLSLIPVTGKRTELSFALLQEKSLSSVNSPVDFGKVEYYFDSAAQALFRNYRNFAAEDKPGAAVLPQPLLTGIESMSFKYYYFDLASKKGTWEEEISATLPSAVMIEVNFRDNNKLRKLTKIITIYVAGLQV